MSDIVEFLLTRIAEDEADARAATSIPEGCERTVSVRDSVHAPASEAAGELDAIGDWGWSGGPVEAATDPLDPLVRAFGPIEADLDHPYAISDSGLWDESEPTGAAYFRATVPATAGAGTARHIARHNPARVLAECEAKRRIVDAHGDYDGFCATCHDYYEHDGIEHPCRTLLALAQPYADHPDYDPAWRFE